MAEFVVTRKVVLDVPIERAWELLTKPEHVKEWFGLNAAKIERREGGTLTYRWEEHGSHHGTVTVAQKPTRFGYRWSQLVDAHPAPGNATEVWFELEEADGGTLVIVRERGFEELKVEGLTPREMAAACADSWAACMVELHRMAARE